jgi:hypothetical protein
MGSNHFHRPFRIIFFKTFPKGLSDQFFIQKSLKRIMLGEFYSFFKAKLWYIF